MLIEADIVDLRYGVKGFVVLKPWGMLAIKQIYKLLEQELEARNHLPALFPTLIPEEFFEKEKEHVKGFKPQVFWVTEAGEKKLRRRLALRPTSETAIYSMYSLWIKGLKDLPLKFYQSCQVFRYETKATRPLLRQREFLWIESHCAFASEQEAYAQCKQDMEICNEVLWEKLAIPFFFFQRPEWDKFPGAEVTYGCDVMMPEGKVLQVATTHMLGQRFSKPFEIKFMDKDGNIKHVWQTCFGPGITRILAACIALHRDEKGIVFPFDIAPVQVMIVPIYYNEQEKVEVINECKKLQENLKTQGFRVEVDLSERTPGEKFYHWEFKGVPFRIEIGPKEVKSEKVVVAKRLDSQKLEIAKAELGLKLRELAKLMLEQLKQKAEKIKSNVIEVETKEELIKALEQGKIVKASFCMKEACAEDLKLETGAEIRGKLFLAEEKPKLCVWCGKEGKEVVYIARAY